MRFRVMTYNIHRAIGLDRRFRPERMIRIIESHQPDIVLLQEVDDGVPRSREMDLARELAVALGYPHVAVGHNVALRKGRYGNATLSRHPILRERNIDLTIGTWKGRGCQHTAIVLNGRVGRSHHLEVFNLHLGLAAHQRELQVALLARSGELASLLTDVACLVGGDFNDWRSLLQPFFTKRLRFRSATERSPKGETAIPTYPAFYPKGPLDRIYYRGPLRLLSARRCRLRLSRIASDHLPIVADFEIH
ncbi:MAG TPA: endonuclease/exonuclease/phosphatase family protein [Vicinamibacteria bacterium]|nr:endonuclease/exonuclease/phosphatase family protein [Vicinamibacteria bacterium]